MRRYHLYLLILIVIIATFLRLYHITTTPPGLYPDEAMNGSNAQEAIATGNFKVFYPENNGREGLFINIQAVFLKVIGQNEPWVLRLPSAIFGILTVLGIFFLTKELFRKNHKSQASNYKQTPSSNFQDRKSFGNWDLGFGNYEVALLAAFLMATSFWHIMFSRIGFRAIMAPFFITWALYFLLRGYRAIREKMPFRKATVFHIVGGAIFGLGFYSYIAYRVTPALVFLMMLFYFMLSRKEKWQKAFLHTSGHFIFFAILVTIPLGIYFIQHPQDFLGRTSQVSVFASATPARDLAWNAVKTIGMFNVMGDWNQRHNEGGRPELFWPVGILFLVGTVVVARSLTKKVLSTNNEWKTNVRIRKFAHGSLFADSNFGFVVLLAWFLLAIAPVVISNEGLPHALRSILLIPPAIILAAVGGIYTYQFLQKFIRASLVKPLAAIFLIFLAVEAYSTYFLIWAKNPNTPGAFAADYVALGRQLNALPIETTKYVVVEAGGVLVRGIPMPAQTVMFVTDTFTPEKQAAKNMHYVMPENENTIPAGAMIFRIK